MRIIRPVEITDTVSPSRLTSSNVPETDHQEWGASATYAAGEKVMVTDAGVHARYEALRTTTGEDPSLETSTTGSDPAWLRLGSTNRWAMFGQVVQEVTEGSAATSDGGTGIEVVVDPGASFDAIAFFNLTGAGVRVQSLDGSTVEYDQTFRLLTPLAESTWHAYLFEPYSIESKPGIVDLPLRTDNTLRVIISSSGSSAKCGAMVLGRAINIGDAEYGSSVETRDFSSKERDEFGFFRIVERGSADRASIIGKCEYSRTTFVKRLLDEVRTTPVVWEAGGGDILAFLLYGFYVEAVLRPVSPSLTELSLELEGLV